MTDRGTRIHIGGSVTGQVAIGDFVYQAQAPGGVINQIVVPEPIRGRPRPVDIRPRRDQAAIARSAITAGILDGVVDGPVQVVAKDGWGKTSVVAQLVYQAPIESYRDGVAVIAAWGLSVEDVEQAIFDAFYESTLPDTRQKVTPGQFRASLADVAAAIVVDDLDVPRQHVDRILDGCQACGFVSTSGSQTMWSGGNVFDLPPMDATEAIRLFEHRLGRSVETGESDAVSRFLAGVSGYPMAIVAAAAAVRRGASIIDFLPRIATAGDPIAAIHEEIAETLSLAETRLLSVLDAVRGAPLPPDALGIAAEVDNAKAHLDRLEHDGIIKASSPRYRLSKASAALLHLPDRQSATVAGLAAWCIREQNVDTVAYAGPAIVRSIRSASQRGDYTAAMGLGRSADAAISLSGKWGLWSGVLTEVTNASQLAGDPFVEGWTLHQRGTRSLAEGDSDAAFVTLSRAAEIRREIGDMPGLEVTEHNLALLAPAPAIIPPRMPKPPAPPRTGIPGWAWAMIVVGLLAAAGLVAFLVTQNRPDTPVVVTTVAANGELVATTETIDFFEVLPGTSATAEVDLVNTGPGSVEVDDVSIDGHESLSVGTDCGFLEPGETCRIEITFAPDGPGDAAAEVVVAHSGTNDSVRIRVVGTAIDPPSAFLTVDPVNIDFGLVPRGDFALITRSPSPNEWLKGVEITNEGDLDVQIQGMRTDSDRFVPSTDCVDLSSGQSCTLEVRFLATDPGVFEATLFIDHTADNAPFEIPITGVVAERGNLTIEVVEVTDAVSDQAGAEFAPARAVVAITNSGQTATTDAFDYRFERSNPSDDVVPWIPALTEKGTFATFTFTGSIGPGETILVATVLGFPLVDYRPGSITVIRAEVDSCFAEEFIAVPPCRIAESDEEDNMSEPVDVTISFTVEP